MRSGLGSGVRSLDQRRAASAYAYVDDAQGDAVGLCQRLPEMLRINGLLATWAFLLKKDHATPLPAILSHLRSLDGLEVPETGDARAAFLHWVGGAEGRGDSVSGVALRELSHEALAFAGWLKRAAEAQENPEEEGASHASA